MDSSYNSPTTKPIFRAVQWVWYLLGLLEALLAFRVVMRALGANPGSAFVDFIYGITRPFAAPFFGIFSITQVQGSVLEWTTLVAMLVYWLAAWAIVKLFLMTKTVSTPEAAQKLNKEEDK